MNEFIKCLIFLTAIGIISFFLGRLLLKGWFHYDRFPYKAFAFERGGELYIRLGVRRWKEQFPDMSVILPKLIPSKKLPSKPTAAMIEAMIRETCVAEWTHKLLALVGFGCTWIWKGVGGWTISLLYALGNIPYVIIQRYNRPKLLRLMERLEKKESASQNRGQQITHEESFDFKLQYGRGA